MMLVTEDLKHWILLVRVLFWNELIVVVELLYVYLFIWKQERRTIDVEPPFITN